MKKIYLATCLIFVSVFQVALAQPKLPTLSTETKKAIEESADTIAENSVALEQTYEVRKKAILETVDYALNDIQEVNKAINQSIVLTKEQKNEFLTVSKKMEKILMDYKVDVQGTTSSDELYSVNKEVVKLIIASKEEIKEAAAKAALLGISSLIKSAEIYLETAKMASGALKGCKVDTSAVDQDIAEAEKTLIELKAAYEVLNADGKATLDEANDLKKAGKIGASLSSQLTSITIELEELAQSCPLIASLE